MQNLRQPLTLPPWARKLVLIIGAYWLAVGLGSIWVSHNEAVWQAKFDTGLNTKYLAHHHPIWLAVYLDWAKYWFLVAGFVSLLVFAVRRIKELDAANPIETKEGKANTINFPALDGLRAIAYLMVFGSHTLPFSLAEFGLPTSLDPLFLTYRIGVGAYGVTLFFALSSFLITTLLIEERDRTGTVNIKDFYVRRLLRIWPLYFAIIAATLFITYHTKQGLTADTAIQYATFRGNFLNSRVGSQVAPMIGHLWSVCVEEQFYLLWPVAVFLLGTRRNMALFSLVLIAVGTLFRQSLVGNPSVSVAWFHSLTHLDCFAYGCLAAIFLRPLKVKNSPVLSVLIWAGFMGIIAMEWYWPFKAAETVTRQGMYAYGAQAAVCALIVWLVSCRTKGTLSLPQVRSFGRITYGLYVFHLFVLGILTIKIDSYHWKALMPLTFLITWGLAYVSYRYFEMPFLLLKRRFQAVRSGAV